MVVRCLSEVGQQLGISWSDFCQEFLIRCSYALNLVICRVVVRMWFELVSCKLVYVTQMCICQLVIIVEHELGFL